MDLNETLFYSYFADNIWYVLQKINLEIKLFVKT